MTQPDKKGYWQIPEICREGRNFVFQIGIDPRLDILMQRVHEAYIRFASMPILPEIVTNLEKIVLVSSIHATNSVEGGILTEEEVRQVVESEEKFTPLQEQERRVFNLKLACAYAENLLEKYGRPSVLLTALGFKPEPFHFSEHQIKELHKIAMAGLMPEIELGSYRIRVRGKPQTKVSDPDHGGTYIPPLCPEDIQKLMQALLEWLNTEPIKNLPILYTAPLLHFYFERIHPFTDGNGRIGRILEAMHLRLGMGKFVSYGIWQYYWENIDEYFNVFSRCGKAEKNRDAYPNTAFVEFFLKGMLVTINRLHDRANQIIANLLAINYLDNLLYGKKLNRRQYAIMTQLSKSIRRSDLNRLSWYNALYDKLTKQTKSRDLLQLQELQLIKIDDQDQINLFNFSSGILLSQDPSTQPDK